MRIETSWQPWLIWALGVMATFFMSERDLFSEDVKVARQITITADARRAIDQGLRFLAKRQNKEGAFEGNDYGFNVGVCSLAGMAFLSSGSTPGRGPYGAEIDRCLDYVLSHCQENGFIDVPVASSHGPMYGHGFATLFLAEVYGMTPRDDLREKLSRAVHLIIQSQNDEGGWRYQPQRRDADISVTICQVMALRAARNAGVYVPHETIERCIAYIRRCQNPDGGFMYMLDGGPSQFPRSAAGVAALFSAGVYQGKEIDLGISYLMRFLPAEKESDRIEDETHYYYGHYYAAQAMWQSGESHWSVWYPRIREQLLARQAANGSWTNSICPEYGTAMATIILQMPNQCLPIFQR